jgi:hypothetical protein
MVELQIAETLVTLYVYYAYITQRKLPASGQQSEVIEIPQYTNNPQSKDIVRDHMLVSAVGESVTSHPQSLHQLTTAYLDFSESTLAGLSSESCAGALWSEPEPWSDVVPPCSEP